MYDQTMTAPSPSCRIPTHGNVLIVEDSRTFSSLLSKAVKRELGLEAMVCASYAEAEAHLAECGEDYFAALLDLNLPDAPQGEVVDLVTARKIPSIVFTGEYSDKLRETMWSKRIVDYVLKENLDNIQQVVDLVKRLKRNIGSKVLVVDDSNTSRNMIRALLEVWNYTVLDAENGMQALKVLDREKDIKIMLTDYAMPGMDGLELVREVRRTLSKSRLPIIAVSGSGEDTVSAHLIKAGANDYMHKPFLTEEFYCRLLHNVENSEYIATIREMAEKDYLTGLYNRRTFFRYGREMFARKAGREGFVLAMLDIDHFKKCNDTYGHDAGDEVIRFVAQAMKDHFGSQGLVARFGGEEFCVACSASCRGGPEAKFEAFRRMLENTMIPWEKERISVTVSTGISIRPGDGLESMISRADRLLYEAKEMGRNRVVSESG